VQRRSVAAAAFGSVVIAWLCSTHVPASTSRPKSAPIASLTAEASGDADGDRGRSPGCPSLHALAVRTCVASPHAAPPALGELDVGSRRARAALTRGALAVAPKTSPPRNSLSSIDP
jgi:hypothetical protein